MNMPVLSQTDVQIFGFVSQGYLKTTENNFILSNSKDGSWEFSEAALTTMVSPTDKLRMGVQLFARDLGDQGNHEVSIDWAFGDYRWRDYLGIRAGRFKYPSSLYNDVRDIDIGRVPLLLPQSNYEELSRDFALALNGLNMYGNLPLSLAGDLDYDIFSGGMSIINTRSLLFQDVFYSHIIVFTEIIYMALNPAVSSASYDGFSNEDMALRNIYGFKLSWNTPISGLRCGGAFSSMDFNESFLAHFTMVIPTGDPQNPYFQSQTIPISGEFDVTIQTYFAEYIWNNLTLAAEFNSRHNDGKLKIGSDPAISDKKGEAYYGLASYRINEWLALSAYYSINYPDNKDKDGVNEIAKGNPDYFAWQKDITMTSRFDITPYWILKLEYHIINGAAQGIEVMNRDSVMEKDWSIFAFKSTFSF